MKVQVSKQDRIKWIIVEEYTVEDYEQLIALISSFNSFYPWYSTNDFEDGKCVIYNVDGILINEKISIFDSYIWQYKLEYKGERNGN